MKKSTRLLTAPDSCLVSWNSGRVSYVLLMLTDGSTTELRGAPMWRWLRESLPALLPIRSRRTSSQTSLQFEKNEPDRWRANPTDSQEEETHGT